MSLEIIIHIRVFVIGNIFTLILVGFFRNLYINLGGLRIWGNKFCCFLNFSSWVIINQQQLTTFFSNSIVEHHCFLMMWFFFILIQSPFFSQYDKLDLLNHSLCSSTTHSWLYSFCRSFEKQRTLFLRFLESFIMRFGAIATFRGAVYVITCRLWPQRPRADGSEHQSEDEHWGFLAAGTAGAWWLLGFRGCGRGGGCSGGCRVGVLVAALLDVGRVGLVRAAKVSVAHVLAALVVDTGKLLQLVEVLVVAAVLAVAACTSSAIWISVLGAVDDRLHAQSLVDVPPVVVPEALKIVAALLVGLARVFFVLRRESGVILPGVAEVLEAGVAVAKTVAVAVIDARCERSGSFDGSHTVVGSGLRSYLAD